MNKKSFLLCKVLLVLLFLTFISCLPPDTNYVSDTQEENDVIFQNTESQLLGDSNLEEITTVNEYENKSYATIEFVAKSTFNKQDSDAEWVNNHPIEGGNNGVGIVVRSEENKKFTFAAKKTDTTSELDDTKIMYSAEKVLGDDIAETFILNSNTGEITLKGNYKGGKYKITARVAENTQGSDSYTLWILKYNGFMFPNNGTIITKTGFGTYELQEEGSYNSVRGYFIRTIVTAFHASNDDTFMIALTLYDTDDNGTITYSSNKDDIATVTNDGVVTIVDASRLSEEVTITIEKPEWECFQASKVTYTLFSSSWLSR